MLVQITYTEIQVLKNTIQVEMTKKEYKDYLKKSLKEQEQVYDFTANTDEEHHYSTEIESIITEII
jgi:phosphoglycerate-specific signal transduction histidine kinase